MNFHFVDSLNLNFWLTAIWKQRKSLGALCETQLLPFSYHHWGTWLEGVTGRLPWSHRNLRRPHLEQSSYSRADVPGRTSQSQKLGRTRLLGTWQEIRKHADCAAFFFLFFFLYLILLAFSRTACRLTSRIVPALVRLWFVLFYGKIKWQLTL